ncbi:L-arabinose isomerase [Nesterenkonia alkaliphila]|uniref:L-arabinose isomerase n=1 Tax=Nesterenkonia alkaliphila TaxID=1463631 RepID=A0A7K1UH59_9MICC|nr:L-arabinose isomerase [Nesterenkonia alkaliphila]MVT25810.1 L-arabinose isomerase [Nesterenkonia alkaliphila]GFZ94705.1 L-arabinose isomerase [Nesterenkonia alkaliphila]
MTTLPSPFEGKSIWLLTGSQDLYGEEILNQVTEQSRRVAATLDEAPQIPADVTWQPVLKDRASIHRAALTANADPTCLGVVVWMHTFSPAKMWIAGLGALDKPMLHLHTQAEATLPWGEVDMDFMNLNQAAHGDREFAYIATRISQRRKTVVGHASAETVRQKVGTWVRAAAGWDALRTMRLARFGDNMRNVAVTEGDKTEAEIRLGTSVNTWAVNDLVERVEAVTEEQIQQTVAEYDAAYQVVSSMVPGSRRRQELEYAARQEVGIREFLSEGGFTAFTTNFEDLGGLRQLPGLAVQRLMAAGYGFGAEGDWKTAMLVRAAKVMGYGLPGGASLMEDYTYEMTPGREKILGAHMLEVCPTLTTETPRLEIHPLAIGDREDPPRLVFTADPGPGVVVAMSDLRERFRLTVNKVNLVPPDAPLPRLPVAHAVWQPEPDFATSAECWLMAGAAHHSVLSTALGLEAFEDLAEIAGIELAVIDQASSPRSFGQELRWNAAYHRLAQGL